MLCLSVVTCVTVCDWSASMSRTLVFYKQRFQILYGSTQFALTKSHAKGISLSPSWTEAIHQIFIGGSHHTPFWFFFLSWPIIFGNTSSLYLSISYIKRRMYSRTAVLLFAALAVGIDAFTPTAPSTASVSKICVSCRLLYFDGRDVSLLRQLDCL